MTTYTFETAKMKAQRTLEATDLKTTALFMEHVNFPSFTGIHITSHEWEAQGFHMALECHMEDLLDFKAETGTPDEELIYEYAFHHIGEWEQHDN